MMQTNLYGFRAPPFQMTPDARLFYPSVGHSRAYSHLLYGLAQQEGFVVVTGEVGSGKTTLAERLCAEIGTEGFAVARIVTTQVGPDDLLRLVADAFNVTADGDKASVLRAIIAALRTAERRHLLLVDEAQGLPLAALEELRMLSNVTRAEGGGALLQTMLLGQPQLRRTLASPDLEQLRQRILASYHLGALAREETRAYVEHRMRAVGWDGYPSWDARALDIVHDRTGGIPRRINRLCSRVLLAGALEELPELTAGLVDGTALELEDDLGGPATAATLAGSLSGHAAHAVLSAPGLDGLARRIEALERTVARRERVFDRMLDLFGDVGSRR